ncbi:type II toxin-antitoxin system ParD family antitoxin [Sandaracinobacteroides saxicola]|uniref:Type II toxin-antitoxin system ParD family antitoxin n=2 Tax=Sandaracinobacteroides saxicola TaxID=2759707 RepID=A0A7G5IMY0_9SPHN|nr:type II toxin-antitoxin system ParD family antitoxin [Sandaracinobacteroides saxicola]
MKLGPYFDRLIEGQIASGRYGSVDDVIREALTRLQDHETRVEALGEALREGEESGLHGPLDANAFLQECRAARSA